MLRTMAMAGLLLAAGGPGGHAMKGPDIPADAPNDAVMARPAEVRAARDWAADSFAGKDPSGALRLTVRRQDHSHLHFGQSCIGTPLQIGSKSYRRGLGTHAVSEIAVALPPGAREFRAFVGVDNNASTGGTRGTVLFTLEADGRELFRSATLRGGQEPVAVKAALPEGARELALKVSDAGDGAAYDQADWAEAQVVMADGKSRWLDAGQPDLLFAAGEPPFSFRYDGRPSSAFLRDWPRTVETKEQADHTAMTVRWTDPQTGLRVTADVKAFKRYPAVDWVLSFENTSAQDTPLIEDVQALDARLRTGYSQTPVQVHQLRGDSCSELSFQPFTTTLEAGKPYRMAPTGGRPSSISAFPWFNAQYADFGAIVAVGWTGQWAAEFDRAGNGPTRLTAGMERTHLRLHPGEAIRTPRILAQFWRGDRQAAHVRFRRLVMFHYAPKQDGKPARMPLALQTFDRYRLQPGWATEDGQKAYAQVAKRLGCDSLWLDAAWFPGGFPNGVGTWRCDPAQFPNGLQPVGELTRALGLKFILWFEPERVAPGSEIARERPEWVMGGASGGLFKLNDPEARVWMTGLLSRRIAEYGVNVYRQDFNIDPLGFWRGNDAADRQGMTEIRYVEGLYAMWDELRARHPGLLIDNCAGGGRRLDLEMVSRSVPLWRSDTGCSPGHPEWNQVQSVALAQYLPLYTVGLWSPDPYEARSAATAGAACEWPYLDPAFPEKAAQATLAEIEANRSYWYGDLYPLTPISSAPDQFMAWQLHRADRDAGLVLAFRHAGCALAGVIAGLRGLDPKATYRVEFVDDAFRRTVQTISGRDLQAGLALRVPRPGGSLLVRYGPAKAGSRTARP